MRDLVLIVQNVGETHHRISDFGNGRPILRLLTHRQWPFGPGSALRITVQVHGPPTLSNMSAVRQSLQLLGYLIGGVRCAGHWPHSPSARGRAHRDGHRIVLDIDAPDRRLRTTEPRYYAS